MELTWLACRGLTRNDLDGLPLEVRDTDRGPVLVCDYRDSSGGCAERIIDLAVEVGGFRWAPGSTGKGAVLTLGDVEAAGTVVVCEGESDGLTLWRHLRRRAGFAVLCVPGAGMVGDDLANFIGRPEMVIVATDADAPGDACAHRIREVLAAAGVDIGALRRYRPRTDKANADVRDDVEVLEAALVGVPEAEVAERVAEMLATAEPFPGAAVPLDDSVPRFVRLSQVEEREIEWLWDRRIARGNVVVLAGDGAMGKSTLAQEVGARITRGDELPGGTRDVPRSVMILTAEEDAGAVIRPRMRLMGADLDRVAVLDPDAAQVTFPSGAAILERWCRAEDVGLVVVDTGAAFLDPDLSSNREEHVRQFLAPLKQIAERLRLVVIVLAHLNKSSGVPAGHRLMGGAAWRNAPRQVLLVGPPPNTDPRESGDRLVAVEKSNLGEYPPAVAFTLTPAPGDRSRAVVEWGGEVEGIGPGDLVTSGGRHDTDDAADARDVLLEILDDGPVTASEFERAARDAGVSRDMFQTTRAAPRRYGDVVKWQEPQTGRRGARSWWWSLPIHFPDDPPGSVPGSESREVKHPSNHAGFGGQGAFTSRHPEEPGSESSDDVQQASIDPSEQPTTDDPATDTDGGDLDA